MVRQEQAILRRPSAHQLNAHRHRPGTARFRHAGHHAVVPHPLIGPGPLEQAVDGRVEGVALLAAVAAVEQGPNVGPPVERRGQGVVLCVGVGVR